MKIKKLLLPLFVFLAFSLNASIKNATTFATVKIYVNGNISNQGNGTSWTTAFKSIDDAITEAKKLLTTNTEVHIWVQKGSYKATATALPSNLHIYGGFTGSETDLSERTAYLTTLANATIISPLGADTDLFTIDTATNIKINGIVFKDLEDVIGSSTILKVYNTSSNIFIEHCLFNNNKNFSGGAALQILNSVVKVSFTKFSNNAVLGNNNAGGAVQINSSTVEFYASTFSRNSSELDYGGALYVAGNSANLTFNYTNFIANKAQKGASAIYFDELSGTASFFRSVVSFNRSELESTDKFGALHATGNTNGLTVNLESNYTVFSDNWKKSGSSYVYSASISSTNATITNVDNPTIDYKKSSSSQSESYFDTQDKKETRQMLLKPLLTSGDPEIGKVRKVQFSEYNGTSVYHTIHLPENWDATKKHPVLVDISGNPFNHTWGDYSTGKPESSYYGYAISNKNAITVTLPMINQNGDAHTSQLGDVQKTIAYIKKAMVSIVEDWGGDPARILLGGYSRGGVGASFLGKYDDEIADIWLGWYHYDGYDYPYAPTINLREFTYNTTDDDWDVDGGIARRFARTKGRSTLIAGSGFSGAFNDYNATYNFPVENFGTSSQGRNHNPIWSLGDNSISEKARNWYLKTITELTGTAKFTGKLINLSNGNPLENAIVKAGITRFVTTDVNGSFSFDGLPKGEREFIITLQSGKVITKTITIDGDLNENISVCDGDFDTCFNEAIIPETLDAFHYNIISKSNSKGLKTSSEITVFTSNIADDNQKLKFKETSIENEYYLLSNDAKYLTSVDGTSQNKVTLQNDLITGQEAKFRWKVIKSDETNFFFIKNVGADLYLNSLASANNDDAVTLLALTDNNDLKWQLNLEGTINFDCNFTVDGILENTCEKEVNENSEITLSVTQNSTGSWSWIGPNNYVASTKSITLSNVTNLNSGIYTLTFTTKANTKITKEFNLNVIAYHTPAVSEEGFYRLVNNANNKAIRGYNGNSGSTYFGYADNAGVTIYTDNTVWSSLKFKFLSSENSNEFYLTGVGAGKYLTSIDPTNNNNATLQTNIIENEKDKFLWLLIKTSTVGVYFIKNKATNLYLSSDANASNNNYITLINFNDTNTIKWNLKVTVTALKCSSQIGNSQEEDCNPEILVGETVILSPKPDVYSGTWSWTGPNSFTANTRVIKIDNIIDDQFGNYKVIYTNEAGNELTLSYAVSDKSLSLDINEFDKSIKVYPNPIKDVIQLDVKKYVGKSAIIKILSLLGQMIYVSDNISIKSGIIQQQLDSSIKNGVYIICLNIDGHKLYQQKIIID